MERLGTNSTTEQQQNVETFDSLKEKLTKIYTEQIQIKQQLDKSKQQQEQKMKMATDKETDDVDQYIRQLKQGETMNMKLKWQLRKQLLILEHDEKKNLKNY